MSQLGRARGESKKEGIRLRLKNRETRMAEKNDERYGDKGKQGQKQKQGKESQKLT